MLPLKLVRSLILGETLNNSTNPLLVNDETDEEKDRNVVKTPLLLFLPTKELIADTYRLSTIARDMGFDLHPTPSLSHIILTHPPPPRPPSSYSSSSPSSASPSSFPSTWSSTSLSSTSSLPEDTVPLPFPSLISAPVPHLRAFVKMSRGLFKLVYAPPNCIASEATPSGSHWNCCSGSLFSRLTGDRIDTMERFSRALAGVGWTLFKTKDNNNNNNNGGGGKPVYMFRKVDVNRVRAGECRIRELRLPALDFRNAPLRILQYILLMTDDIFYLA